MADNQKKSPPQPQKQPPASKPTRRPGQLNEGARTPGGNSPNKTSKG